MAWGLGFKRSVGVKPGIFVVVESQTGEGKQKNQVPQKGCRGEAVSFLGDPGLALQLSALPWWDTRGGDSPQPATRAGQEGSRHWGLYPGNRH